MIPVLLGLANKLDTLIARLTAPRAALMDNMDAAVSTRAAAATALSTTQWTNTLATNLGSIATKGPLAVPKASGLAAATRGLLAFTSLSGITSAATVLQSAQGTNCEEASGTSTSYADAIDYDGSGFLDFCMGISSNGWICDFEIIIDGVTVFSGNSFGSQVARVAVGSAGWVARLNAASNWDNWLHINPQPIPFNSNVQIRYKRGTGSGGDTTVGVLYRVVKTS